MRYLTWKLNWEDDKNGTGPEQAIKQQGGHAEASFFVNPDEYVGEILGYLVSGNIQIDSLDRWQVREISQQQALEFAQVVAPDAYLLDDGIITVPPRDPPEV